MNKDDIEFLKNLQHEMLTQDNVGQADPRFWVVRQTEKIYGVDFDFDSDGYEIVKDSETIAEDYDELLEWAVDSFDEENLKLEDISNADELIEYLNEYFDTDIYKVYYRNVEVNIPNTMFLTLRKCQEHIKTNYYHYNATVHPYAMTAERSPQVERLYKILQNTNWGELEGK